MLGFASAQAITVVEDGKVELKKDTLNPARICQERGHIPGSMGTMTLMYIGSYLIETDSTTIRVTPPGNWFTTSCERCGVEITEQEPEIREVIWRRKKE